MKKVLFTGFEPFGSEKRNPSWEAVKLLPGTVDEIEIVRLKLPVVYDECARLLLEAIRKHQPDAVICVGQAGGRSSIAVENFALNVKAAKSPDNAGVVFEGEKIVSDGPAAYESTLPVRRMVNAMEEAGVPAAVSYCAGTYVCNNVMYHLLHDAAQNAPERKAGFIHLPYDEIQAQGHDKNVAFLPLSQMAEGLKACVRVLW